MAGQYYVFVPFELTHQEHSKGLVRKWRISAIDLGRRVPIPIYYQDKEDQLGDISKKIGELNELGNSDSYTLYILGHGAGDYKKLNSINSTIFIREELTPSVLALRLQSCNLPLNAKNIKLYACNLGRDIGEKLNSSFGCQLYQELFKLGYRDVVLSAYTTPLKIELDRYGHKRTESDSKPSESRVQFYQKHDD